jgi:hypothetical protein
MVHLNLLVNILKLDFIKIIRPIKSIKEFNLSNIFPSIISDEHSSCIIFIQYYFIKNITYKQEKYIENM